MSILELIKKLNIKNLKIYGSSRYDYCNPTTTDIWICSDNLTDSIKKEIEENILPVMYWKHFNEIPNKFITFSYHDSDKEIKFWNGFMDKEFLEDENKYNLKELI